MISEESVVVKIEVTNTSNVDGEEVIQWYIHDHFANAARPIKELKYFEKELIKAGETKTFMFEISEETLKYYDHNEDYVAEPGSFSVMVGPNSSELQTIHFHLGAE
jgi:beta-glucosidase